jgi:cytochrome b subunit of formate dehydrogenase
MKTKMSGKYNSFQKLMIIILPIIVLLLIAAIVMCLAFSFLPMSIREIINTGNATIILSVVSSGLAVLGIAFAFFSKSNDSE